MPALLSIETALPAHSAPQKTTATFMRRVAAATLGVDEGNEMLGKLERFYAKSGIERRYSVIPDYTMRDPEAFAFYGKNWELEPFPTTGRRMELFEQESVPLAARACRDAMQQAGVRPDEVTHLIVTTCTGFFAPGLDVMLLRELELSPSTQRLQIGFMGCYAGFNGMRQAHQIITAEPDAVVVQVCIELCSLHYQKDASLDSIVANCLFADGCAAAVWGRDERGGLATIEGTACAVDGDSLDEMSWHIGDHGFRMGLRVDVPKTIERELPEFVEDLLASHTTQRAEIDRWAVHPGGRAILEAAEAALGLEDESLAIPRSVLRDFGNMSSATIFFVLQREFEQAAPGERVVALGFGPGLTFEAALMEAK